MKFQSIALPAALVLAAATIVALAIMPAEGPQKVDSAPLVNQTNESEVRIDRLVTDVANASADLARGLGDAPAGEAMRAAESEVAELRRLIAQLEQERRSQQALLMQLIAATRTEPESSGPSLQMPIAVVGLLSSMLTMYLGWRGDRRDSRRLEAELLELKAKLRSGAAG